MQLTHLRLFVKVAETGSFSRAGAALSIAQPAVSRVIRQLEEQSGAQLFYRHGRGVALTEAGQRFAHHANEMLRHVSELQSELSDLQGTLRGTANVAMPPGVGRVIMVPVIKRFKELYPEAAIRVMEFFTGDTLEQLSMGTLDVGLTYSTLATGGATREPLVREQIYLVGRLGAKGTENPEITIGDLATLPLILPTRSGGLRDDIDRAFAKLDLAPNIVLEVDATEPLINLVREGLGYTVLPICSVHKELKSGEFAVSRLVSPVIERELSLATSTSHPLTAVAREATRIIRDQLFKHCATGGWVRLRPTR